MPAIHQLAQAAQNGPTQFLKIRNGDSDDDNDGKGGIGMPGGVMAVIIVAVLVFVSIVACCCLCRRRKRKANRNSDKDDGSSSGNNKPGFDPTKYVKKAIKKCMKKIKSMVKKKNKNKKPAAGPTSNFNQETAYGQGTHPGYGQNERVMGNSKGYDRLEGENEERVALASSPYGARNDH